MFRHPFLIGTLAAVFSVFLGALECNRQVRTPVEVRGERIYGRMCAVCHGPNGEGYRADEAPAVGKRAFLGTASDVFMRRAINDGRTGTTMSAWSTAHGGPLSGPDVDAVIAYLRTLQPGAPVAVDQHQQAGHVEEGARLFERECARCHGARGTGGPNVGIGNPELLASATDAFLRHAITNGRPETAMPSFGEKLGKQGVDDVLAHLRDLQRQAAPPPPEPPAPPPPIPLGPVPLNPKGPEPAGFQKAPATTHAELIHSELERGAKMAILDARAPQDYRNGHIAGAVSVPFYDVQPYVTKLPKNAWLVAYCACPHAESGQLAQRLLEAGFEKVTILDEGLGFWRSKHFATHEGDDP
ncbi:MAG TPA: c-type cytochrome [Polyangiaceae bacterium]|nr:c-type cytochrome [Polyangiaceae bacterium]